MKKIFFAITSLCLTTGTSLGNTNIIVNIGFKYQNIVFKHNWAFKAQGNNAVENWYKPFAHNRWKVFITRDTWLKKFLPWISATVVGKLNKQMLKNRFFKEIKSWPRGGNRKFSDKEYYYIVDYALEHMIEISNKFAEKETINRIVFETKSNNTWVGVKDASEDLEG